MTESAEPKPIVPKFITKITHRDLNGDNYLQWKRIVEINLTDCEKNSHLYTDPPSFKTDEWERDDDALFSQLLNIMEPKIQDLVMHMSTIKEMWKYLVKL